MLINQAFILIKFINNNKDQKYITLVMGTWQQNAPTNLQI